jgi:hypothetical protein
MDASVKHQNREGTIRAHRARIVGVDCVLARLQIPSQRVWQQLHQLPDVSSGRLMRTLEGHGLPQIRWHSRRTAHWMVSGPRDKTLMRIFFRASRLTESPLHSRHARQFSSSKSINQELARFIKTGSEAERNQAAGSSRRPTSRGPLKRLEEKQKGVKKLGRDRPAKNLIQMKRRPRAS